MLAFSQSENKWSRQSFSRPKYFPFCGYALYWAFVPCPSVLLCLFFLSSSISWNTHSQAFKRCHGDAGAILENSTPPKERTGVRLGVSVGKFLWWDRMTPALWGKAIKLDVSLCVKAWSSVRLSFQGWLAWLYDIRDWKDEEVNDGLGNIVLV